MGFAAVLLFVSVLAITSTTTQSFNCSSNRICNALVDYKLPNATAFSAIQALFGVDHFRSILGVNNYPLSTLRNQTVPANETIKIPFPCRCTNGTGRSNRRPIYTVVDGDTLWHIAAQVFSGLVTYPEIQAVNQIPDADNITVGQVLWIPLPCNCDEVEGQRVVHYGHLVASGSTVEGIAQTYNTTSETLLRLNGLATPNDLLADSILDVPLKACTSMVRNDSLDYPLLVSNGTYVFTASNCVTCRCDVANNWTLQCGPSQLNLSSGPSCPSIQCQGADNLYLGNTTSSTCNRTTCAYAGYNNQTIFTTLAVQSTCPVSGNSGTRFSLQGWTWNVLLMSIHLVLLCLHFFQ